MGGDHARTVVSDVRCGGLAGYVVNEATHYERPEPRGKALEGGFAPA